MSIANRDYTDAELIGLAKAYVRQSHSIAKMVRLILESCCRLADPAGAAKIRRWWGL
jgi:hypothetical protein